MAQGPISRGPIIISEEPQLTAIKGDIECGKMNGVKYHLINEDHFCLRDPASENWRNNTSPRIKVIQTTNMMLPHFQIFQNEVGDRFFGPLFYYRCKYCKNVTFEVLQN